MTHTLREHIPSAFVVKIPLATSRPRIWMEAQQTIDADTSTQGGQIRCILLHPVIDTKFTSEPLVSFVCSPAEGSTSSRARKPDDCIAQQLLHAPTFDASSGRTIQRCEEDIPADLKPEAQAGPRQHEHCLLVFACT
ncbi:unnamed protein product [Protopolystoma xenopodis]|uniref:Uncharacterized protein n=1 Tax=Protopolystoma xenopodis TaxID=117903 RepID=A0A3S5CDQ3_9PLAT|nr:unnamed protein product [Protopolystoma xenopodis]